MKQKYNFAQVEISFFNENKKEIVIVGLKPQEEMPNKSSFNDDDIFFYFNGYEELLECLTQYTHEDFTITDIISLIK